MAYKFQFGAATMSGSLTQENGIVSDTTISASTSLSADSLTVGNSYGLTGPGVLTVASMGGNWTNASRTVADMGTVTTMDLNGGNIDGTVIGATTVAAGSFAAVVGTTGTYSAVLKTDDTTEATSTTDGSLQTDGGLSVAKSAVIGDDLDLLSDGAILNIGSAQKFTATHANSNNTLRAASGARLAFGDNGEYISGDGTDLKIVSSGDVDITGDTDVVGGLSSTQATTLASAAGVTTIGSTTGATFSAAGLLNVNNATDATSKTDGSLQTDGGLSVAKAIYNGTAATFAADSGIVTMGAATALTVSAAGLLNVNNATEATSATDGSLQTDGGLSVVKSAVIGDDLDLLSDGAIVNIGSTSKFTLTDQAANNCVMAASGARLAFGNAGEYITGDGTDLALVSSGDVDITATTVEMSVGAAGVKITGTTPLLTIGDAAAEDTTLLFDGNAKDFYVALDDSSDKLVIGEGSTVGTNSILTITDDTVTLGDGAAVDCNFVFDGNAADWSVGIDDSDDLLELRGGTTPASNVAVAFNSSGELKKLNAAAAAVTVANDHIMFYDGGATAVPKVESIADLATAMAGTGITATNGVFSTDASSTPNEITIGATCAEGFNYINSTLTGAFAAYLPASPSSGDIVYVKARDGVTTTNSITILRTTAGHTIDGQASLVIESPYGAVALSYVNTNDWRLF